MSGPTLNEYCSEAIARAQATIAPEKAAEALANFEAYEAALLQDRDAEPSWEAIATLLDEVDASALPQSHHVALQHWTRAFGNPTFTGALERARRKLEPQFDAFDMAAGRDIAIAMAGFGLAVAPFDRTRFRLLAEPSRDIDTVAKTFLQWKSAYVGYAICEAPFHLIITDCVKTCRSVIAAQPALQPVDTLLGRSVPVWPEGPFPSFKHGVFVVPREAGDRFTTRLVALSDPTLASVGLYTGWIDGGTPIGGESDDGFHAVMTHFAKLILNDPEIALSLWHEPDAAEAPGLK